jgi:hypothetical protein
MTNAIDKIATDDLAPNLAPAPATKPERQLRVTGRLAVALSKMVWEGLTRDQAAVAAGMRPHSVYCALKKSHVAAHYLAECETLRLSGKSRRLHRLAEIAEQSTNLNAAVAAIKTAEGQDDATRINISVGLTCGWIIDLSPDPPQQQAQRTGVSHAHAIGKVSEHADPRVIEHNAERD